MKADGISIGLGGRSTMCGRFYVDNEILKELESLFKNPHGKLRVPVVGDVHPSEKAVVIVGDQTGLYPETMNWGFKQYQGTGLIINARAESALEKPMFSGSVLERRCVIPAGHFYEWNRQREKATFKSGDSDVLYMAGIYQTEDDERRFTILTTKANDSMKPVHGRMPVILSEEELQDWIVDEKFMRQVLTRTPMMLKREQEFEQLSLF